MKKLLFAALVFALHARLPGQENPYVIQKSDFITLKNSPPVSGGGGTITGGTCGAGEFVNALDTAGLPTCATPAASSVAVGDITGLGAGVAAWLASGTSADLRTALTDETGGGRAVFNNTPDLITPVATNGNTGGGYIDFTEDTDNGANFLRLKAPNAITGDFTLSFPDFTANGDVVSTTFLNAWGDGIKQTFNPSATTSGMNFGSVAGYVSSPDLGDAYTNSDTNTPIVHTGASGIYPMAIGCPGPACFFEQEEFSGATAGVSDPSVGLADWVVTNTGTAAGVTGCFSPNFLTDRAGCIAIHAGTAAAGSSSLQRGVTAGVFTFGPDARAIWIGSVTDLSDGTDAFTAALGVADGTQAASTDPTDGLFFLYDSAQSANWIMRACSNNSGAGCSQTISSTAIAADTKYVWEIRMNHAATSAEWFVNGVSIGTHATNLPTGSGRFVNPYVSVNGTASGGTTEPRSLNIEYFAWMKPR